VHVDYLACELLGLNITLHLCSLNFPTISTNIYLAWVSFPTTPVYLFVHYFSGVIQNNRIAKFTFAHCPMPMYVRGCSSTRRRRVFGAEDSSTSWPSSSGLGGHWRTYLTIFELADHAFFRMVRSSVVPRRHVFTE
jgi:hypothetical protein